MPRATRTRHPSENRTPVYIGPRACRENPMLGVLKISQNGCSGGCMGYLVRMAFLRWISALREDFLPPTERAGAALLFLESRDVCQASESSRGGGALGFIILPGGHRFVIASRRRGTNLPKEPTAGGRRNLCRAATLARKFGVLQ